MNAVLAPQGVEPTQSVSAPVIRKPASQDAHTPSSGFSPPRNDVSLQPLGESLQALVPLENDWDSYGAHAPTRFALERAWSFASQLVDFGLPVPDVFPTRTGGVQLEWHVGPVNLEWEMDPLGSTGVFVFDDDRTGEKIDGELPMDAALLNVALHRVRTA